MPRIEILNGPNGTEVFEINGGEICGRDQGSEIAILAPGVSRRHFQFLRENDETIVSDLNSANGTYVNGARINRHHLADQDLITVGGVQIRFHLGTAVRPQVPRAQGFGQSPQPQMAGHGGVNAGAPSTDSGPQGGVVYRDDEDDEEAEFDYSVDASMIFQSGRVDAKNADEANEALKKRLRIIYEVSQALGRETEVADLLRTIMKLLVDAFPQTTRGVIMTGDSLQTLVPAAVHNTNPNDTKKIPVSKTILSAVYGDKKAILTEDASNEFGAHLSILELKLSSLMCVPLLSQEKVLGVIQLDTQIRSKKFTPEDLNLLTGIASQAAVFLRNASLSKARANLQRYFSPELANKVAEGEIDLKPGGDMKTGTVFFSDIIGFTSMSHSMTPMEVITKINRYFKIMVDIIFKYQGYIDKFGGDAIMAVWGVPVPIQDEALKAVTAALEMQNALYLFNLELLREGRDDIQMGIGLNAGNFIAGNLGSERRMEYTVIGDQVNLAQRVESKAGRGNVFISPSVFERTGNNVLVAKLQPTNVKGIPHPINIYSVRGAPTRDKGVFLLSIPFLLEDGTNREGLLVKAKDLGQGQILALILLPEKPTQQSIPLRFVPQEASDFVLTFRMQREVPLQANVGACCNGIIDVSGSMIEELITKGIYVSDKTPDQMPRGKTLSGH